MRRSIKANGTEQNEFELCLRILGNELLAIRLAASNFSGKIVVWGVILLLFTFLIMEIFGVNALMGIESGV